MDNLGAIGGPLLAIALVALVGTRSAMLVSVVPGLLASVAILYAIRSDAAADPPDAAAAAHPRSAPSCTGGLGRLLLGVSAFELGNVAATLLILRATQLLTPSARTRPRRHDRTRPLHRLQPQRRTREHPRRPPRRPPRHPARTPAWGRVPSASPTSAWPSPAPRSRCSRCSSSSPGPRLDPRRDSRARRRRRARPQRDPRLGVRHARERSSRSATSPPARPPDCSGPRSHPEPHSSTSLSG